MNTQFTTSSLSSAIGMTANAGTQWFPDPFLDYSGRYMPSNLKNMLRWCELFWSNNGTYRMALERVCAYFLTKVEVLDVPDEIKSEYEDFLDNTLRVTEKLRMVGLDFLFYGNSFTSVYVPFRRYLRCPKCNLDRPIERCVYHFRQFKFHGACPSCKYNGELKRVDRRSMEQDKLRIIRWNPHDMQLLHHPISHDASYLYKIPETFKQQIRQGKAFYLQHTPWEFIEAIRDNQSFRFNDNVIFHLKEDTLAGLQNRGWGLPRAISNFKQGFYIQVLKRYNEALALDYIVPWRVVTPDRPSGPSGKVDPLLHANMADFTSRIRGMISEHRRDPLAMHSLPFPVNYQTLGGEANQLAPHELLTAALDELLNACGVPADLYKGSLELKVMPAALRLFEATWPHLVAGFNNWLNWLLENLSMSFNWDPARARMTPVTRADDAEARLIRLQLSAANKISDQTALAPLGISVRDEIKRMFEEQRMLMEEQRKVEQEQQDQEVMDQRLAETSQAMSGMMAGPMGQAQGPQQPGDVLDRADQMAQQLLAMPEGERRRQLSMIRQTDETLHAVVKQKLQSARTQARSVGQDQVIAQMTGAM